MAGRDDNGERVARFVADLKSGIDAVVAKRGQGGILMAISAFGCGLALLQTLVSGIWDATPCVCSVLSCESVSWRAEAFREKPSAKRRPTTGATGWFIARVAAAFMSSFRQKCCALGAPGGRQALNSIARARLTLAAGTPSGLASAA